MKEFKAEFEGKPYRVRLYRATYQRVESWSGPVYILLGREPVEELPGDLNLPYLIKLGRATGYIESVSNPDIYADADNVLHFGRRWVTLTIARNHETEIGKRFPREPWVPVQWKG